MPTIRKPLFIVPLDLGTVVSGNARAGHPVMHIGRHEAIGLTWRTNGNAGTWARGQFSTASAVNFCAIVSANALAGTQYQLRLGSSQAEVDGTAPYDSGALDFISPAITREDGLYHSHLELPSVVDASWWRIDISGHTGDFEAAHLVLGRSIEPSSFYNLDFEHGIEDLGDIEFTRYGVADETPGVIFRTLDFTLGWQTEAEIEASFRPLIEKLGKRGQVYVVFDPEPTTYRQARTYMGWMGKPPFTKSGRKPRYFAQDFSFISQI